ncbi:MAG: hypothetical protein JNG88_05680 [Phycisphaerales bacterium]|nr:hypothetical protein [Phycisphaerales bacterium]
MRMQSNDGHPARLAPGRRIGWQIASFAAQRKRRGAHASPATGPLRRGDSLSPFIKSRAVRAAIHET